jgi:hypothetical protein
VRDGSAALPAAAGPSVIAVAEHNAWSRGTSSLVVVVVVVAYGVS